MFVDEIKEKLDINLETLPFSVSMLGFERLMLCGVKNVILSSSNEIKVKVKKGEIRVMGESLCIVQMGGGDLYVKGEIRLVETERK